MDGEDKDAVDHDDLALCHQHASLAATEARASSSYHGIPVLCGLAAERSRQGGTSAVGAEVKAKVKAGAGAEAELAGTS